MKRLMVEINFKYKKDHWTPIVINKTHVGHKRIHAFYRLADLCIVSSLHDGMNLVAKEFVASRADEDGILILSRFTGAARELDKAILINPYATDEFAESLKTACEMTKEERKKRMQSCRAVVSDANIYRWAGKFLSTLLRFEFKE